MVDLQGRRVLVTRSAEDCAEWADELERRGAKAVVYPCITTQLIDTKALRIGLAAGAAAADWLVLTSRRGVQAFEQLHPRPLQPHTRIAAVGDSTAQAARAHFGRIDHVGHGTAVLLGDSLTALREFSPGMLCLLAVAANASTLLERKLAAEGAVCARFDIYRTNPANERKPKQPLSMLGVDTIFFASPTAVEGFVNQVDLDVEASVFTIGPSTTAAARSCGVPLTAEARTASIEGLLEAMNAE
jgi:uroporphyrinogen-III synthase